MSMMRWEERFAPLDGIAAVVLWVVGILILVGPANSPDSGAGPARALEFFKDEEGAILAGTFVFMLGALFFLWFLGAVRDRLLVAEGGTNRLTTITFAAGVLTATSLLFTGAVQAAGALNNNNLSPEAAQVYLGISTGFFYAAELAAAVFLLAAGLLTLGKRAFPAWLGWLSLVFSLWLLIPPIGWAALIAAFPIWLIITSLLLWRSREPAAHAPTTAAP